MKPGSNISEKAKTHIRLNYSRMPVSMMAEQLKLGWDTVASFMRQEGLKQMRRHKKADADSARRYSVTKKRPVADGMFNVFEHENWIM